MTEDKFNYLGQGNWRKRVHQLKQELRLDISGTRLNIPEQSGSVPKPKRHPHNGKQATPRNARSHPSRPHRRRTRHSSKSPQ